MGGWYRCHRAPPSRCGGRRGWWDGPRGAAPHMGSSASSTLVSMRASSRCFCRALSKSKGLWLVVSEATTTGAPAAAAQRPQGLGRPQFARRAAMAAPRRRWCMEAALSRTNCLGAAQGAMRRERGVGGCLSEGNISLTEALSGVHGLAARAPSTPSTLAGGRGRATPWPPGMPLRQWR